MRIGGDVAGILRRRVPIDILWSTRISTAARREGLIDCGRSRCPTMWRTLFHDNGIVDVGRGVSVVGVGVADERVTNIIPAQRKSSRYYARI
jgi:hypothetical protein